MNDPDDVVDRILIDGKTGKRIQTEQFFHFLDGHRYVDRKHIYPRCKNILDIQIVELNGCGDQIGFMCFQIPFLLRFVDHCDQLIGNIAVAFLDMYDFGYDPLPSAEQQCQRSQNNLAETYNTDRFHRKAFGILFCNGLRCDFAKQQNKDSQRDCRNKGSVVPVKPREKYRSDRCGGNIHNIVSNQHRGNKTVIPFQYCKDRFRRIGIHGFQPDPACAGICGLNR